MTNENAYRHWWHNLPEAGANAKVQEIERLVADINALEQQARELKVQAQQLDEKIAEDAVKHWGKKKAKEAFEMDECAFNTTYLSIMPTALSRYTAKKQKEENR